ncbi:MAG TPA: glycosyltransferase family 2 protein [Microbacteriaceae bacterium]|nr:glycosyltransferase family 2 protein [Microbacteriaceae bacterium]
MPLPIEPVIPPGSSPAVSYVMPVLNEVDYLEAGLAGILNQDFEGPIEIVLALGPSNDGTNELAARLAAGDPRIRLVDNPAMDIPTGLNVAIAASSGPVIVRVDAHSELPPNYTSLAIAALERTGAANVGGVMMARGKTPFQRMVARAYVSRFGLGGGQYHHEGSEGRPAESAYLGVFRRSVLTEVGVYDTSLKRGEDWELNLRIREAGHLVWYEPRMVVTYWPRSRWRDVGRQFFATGVWRGEVVRRHPTRNSIRYFAPPALVAATTAALAWAGVSATVPGVPGWPGLGLAIAPLSYLLALVAVIASQRDVSLRERGMLTLIFPTMHVSWGLGFLRGCLFGAGNQVDRSRVSRRS